MNNVSKLAISVALAAGLGFVAVPASADVTALAEITKTKDVTVTLDVVKNKSAVIDVDFAPELDGAAEADAITNQTTSGQIIDDTQEQNIDRDEASPFGLDLASVMADSVNDNTGVVGINQDVGVMVNQGNQVALAVVVDEVGETLHFTNAEAFADQEVSGNSTRTVGVLEDINDPSAGADKVITIRGSVNGNSGIIGVNQNAGNANNQSNSAAISVGSNSVMALSESGLGQVTSGNTVEEIETVKLARIVDSVNGNSGVIGVNQSTGNFNNQSSLVAFSALTASAQIGVPSP